MLTMIMTHIDLLTAISEKTKEKWIMKQDVKYFKSNFDCECSLTRVAPEKSRSDINTNNRFIIKVWNYSIFNIWKREDI